MLMAIHLLTDVFEFVVQLTHDAPLKADQPGAVKEAQRADDVLEK